MQVRLFLDSNMMTYIALFEGYLCEGGTEELDSAIEFWQLAQGAAPDQRVLEEAEALRVLYIVDDQAHFDWLFSDVGLDEVMRIRNELRRGSHYHLLNRLIEQRREVYAEEGRHFSGADIARLRHQLFPNIPQRMENDSLQFCEAELVESDYFLTDDLDFVTMAGRTPVRVTATTVRQLPFVARVLDQHTSEE